MIWMFLWLVAGIDIYIIVGFMTYAVLVFTNPYVKGLHKPALIWPFFLMKTLIKIAKKKGESSNSP